MAPLAEEPLREVLKDFARSVTTKFKVLVAGDPEDQIRAPFEVFLKEAGGAMGIAAVPKGESRAGKIGRPDFGIAVKGLLVGYAELKPPGKGADPRYFKGHDKQQWERFQLLPNIIYTDGNQWALYQRGSLVDNMVTLHGDVTKSGVRAVKDDDASRIEDMLWKFFSWRPISARQQQGISDCLRVLVGKLVVTGTREKQLPPLTGKPCQHGVGIFKWKAHLGAYDREWRVVDAHVFATLTSVLNWNNPRKLAHAIPHTNPEDS